MPHVLQKILPRSIVYTDELKSYDGLRRAGYYHRCIAYSEGVYVSRDAHVNIIEGFWSLVKRAIGGVYHVISAKHLQGYLGDDRAQFETLLLRATLPS